MTHLDLFSGIGACSLASHWAGFSTVAYVEIEPFCQAVLRKNFGKEINIHGDIRTFDATPFRGVSLVSGGFPCQDISAAGKGAGLDGSRSRLWFEMLRVVREYRPLFVLVENSPALRTRGIDRVLYELEEAGYTAGASVVGAGNAGFPHRRARCFVVAYSNGLREIGRAPDAIERLCNGNGERSGQNRFYWSDGPNAVYPNEEVRKVSHEVRCGDVPDQIPNTRRVV